MLKEEYRTIKKPTWIRVAPPDDPFATREYTLISNVRQTEPENYDAYVIASLMFHPKHSYKPGWKIIFPGKRLFISDWDIEHASFVKKWPGRNKSSILDSIFSGRALEE